MSDPQSVLDKYMKLARQLYTDNLLISAVQNGTPDDIRILVQLGVPTILIPEYRMAMDPSEYQDKLQEYMNDAFFYAAYAGKIDIMITLIQLGVPIDQISNKGDSAFHFAATGNRVDVIATLVQLGAKTIDQPNNDGKTAFHYAVENYRDDVIIALTQLGALTIDYPDKDGRTPLFLVIAITSTKDEMKGNQVIQTLIRCGSLAIDIPDKNGRTPLAQAITTLQMKIVSTLIQLGTQAFDIPDNNGDTPLHITINAMQHRPKIKEKGIEIINLLVQGGLNGGLRNLDAVNKQGFTSLMVAAQSDQPMIISLLIRYGSLAVDNLFQPIPQNATKVNYLQETPLHLYVRKRNREMISTLLRFGSQSLNWINSVGMSSLAILLENMVPNFRHSSNSPLQREYLEMLKFLLCLGAVITAEEIEVLIRRLTRPPYQVVRDRTIEIIEILLRTEISTEEAMEVRHEVYFQESLTSRVVDAILS